MGIKFNIRLAIFGGSHYHSLNTRGFKNSGPVSPNPVPFTHRTPFTKITLQRRRVPPNPRVKPCSYRLLLHMIGCLEILFSGWGSLDLILEFGIGFLEPVLEMPEVDI